jgi:hypothetical protein
LKNLIFNIKTIKNNMALGGSNELKKKRKTNDAMVSRQNEGGKKIEISPE